MKKLILVILLAATSTAVYAGCRTFTIITSEGTKVCTECCYGNNCTITCN